MVGKESSTGAALYMTFKGVRLRDHNNEKVGRETEGTWGKKD